MSVTTTIDLPEDVYEAASSVAATKDISPGEALADLVRQGLRPPLRFEVINGIPVPILPKDSPVVTREQTLALEDELD